jgi:hypothetical protein
MTAVEEFVSKNMQEECSSSKFPGYQSRGALFLSYFFKIVHYSKTT